MIVAAGALGTNKLLADCRHRGSLPRLSDRIGHVVRSNSESIQAVTAPDDERDFAQSVAITSSIYPDPDTHVEVVTYGHGGDLMSRLFTVMTGPGTRVTRPLKWIGAMLRHPLRTLRLLWPFGWSRRTVILLVMQTTDAAMRLVPKRRLLLPRHPSADRAGSGAPEPDLHTGRGQGGGVVRRADRRHRPVRDHGVEPQHPDDRAHPRRRGDRRRA